MRFGELHFITCSCYRRMPLLASPYARDRFLKILSKVRDRYDFGLFGFVLVPEHIHLLIRDADMASPSDVIAALKQRVARALRGESGWRLSRRAGSLWDGPPSGRDARFWQRYHTKRISTRESNRQPRLIDTRLSIRPAQLPPRGRAGRHVLRNGSQPLGLSSRSRPSRVTKVTVFRAQISPIS